MSNKTLKSDEKFTLFLDRRDRLVFGVVILYETKHIDYRCVSQFCDIFSDCIEIQHVLVIYQ